MIRVFLCSVGCLFFVVYLNMGSDGLVHAKKMKNLNIIYNKVLELSESNLWDAIKLCEDTIKDDPENKEMDQIYYICGKIQYEKKGEIFKYKTQVIYDHRARDPENKLTREYVDKYLYDFYVGEGREIFRSSYLNTLLKKYADSKYVEYAHYVLSMEDMEIGCEGSITCAFIETFPPLEKFAKKYPRSSFLAKLTHSYQKRVYHYLQFLEDYNKKTEEFDPEKVKEHLAKYDAMAENFEIGAKKLAYLFLADMWNRLLNYKRARELYSLLLKMEISVNEKDKISGIIYKIPEIRFVLNPPLVVSHDQVELSWKKPPVSGIKEYIIYRAERAYDREYITARDKSIFKKIFKSLGMVSSDKLIFSDKTVKEEMKYDYKIKVVTSKKEYFSQMSPAITPEAGAYFQKVMFVEKEKQVLLFGRTQTKVTEVWIVDGEGKIQEKVRAEIYGIKGLRVDGKLKKYMPEIWLVDVLKNKYVRLKKSDKMLEEKLKQYDLSEEKLDRRLKISLFDKNTGAKTVLSEAGYQDSLLKVKYAVSAVLKRDDKKQDKKSKNQMPMVINWEVAENNDKNMDFCGQKRGDPVSIYWDESNNSLWSANADCMKIQKDGEVYILDLSSYHERKAEVPYLVPMNKSKDNWICLKNGNKCIKVNANGEAKAMFSVDEEDVPIAFNKGTLWFFNQTSNAIIQRNESGKKVDSVLIGTREMIKKEFISGDFNSKGFWIFRDEKLYYINFQGEELKKVILF